MQGWWRTSGACPGGDSPRRGRAANPRGRGGQLAAPPPPARAPPPVGVSWGGVATGSGRSCCGLPPHSLAGETWGCEVGGKRDSRREEAQVAGKRALHTPPMLHRWLPPHPYPPLPHRSYHVARRLLCRAEATVAIAAWPPPS